MVFQYPYIFFINKNKHYEIRNIIEENESEGIDLNIVVENMWINNNQEYIGRIRNEKGLALSGFRKKIGKKHITMQVVNCGHILANYRYPRVNIPFQSEMVRWKNLLFCGGYAVNGENNEHIWNNDNLLQAVIEGKKPIGFLSSNEEYINSIKRKGLPFKINEDPIGNENLGVSQIGTFSNHFDLEALIKSYQILSKIDGYTILDKWEEQKIYHLANQSFSDYLFSYDYLNPKSVYEFVLTGLILGFPIESTYAILTQ